MQLGGHFSNVLSEEETRLIESSALRILDEMGMEIQNRSLLEALADFGLTVDLGSERVRFPRRFMGRFLEETEKFDWANVRAQLVSSAGIYHGLFHNPFSDALEPWTEDSAGSLFPTRSQSAAHRGRPYARLPPACCRGARAAI